LVKREGRPENVAQAVMALVGNDFITGASLPVEGGRTVYAGGAGMIGARGRIGAMFDINLRSG
jgi:hypothetical protein